MNSQRDNELDSQHSRTHCGIYEESDFRRYLAGAMSEREIERFKSHCTSCDECLSILSQSSRSNFNEQDQRENAILLEKTMNLLNKIDRE
jgi:hypothetical protein